MWKCSNGGAVFTGSCNGGKGERLLTPLGASPDGLLPWFWDPKLFWRNHEVLVQGPVRLSLGLAIPV